MRSPRTVAAALTLVSVLTACGGSSPTEPAGDAPDTTSVFPVRVLDEAQRVADQVEQRQADLEERLQDPFAEP